MLLFKTSGDTFDSVIANEKHAFASMPRDWAPREPILVSKNKTDCQPSEKQIQYTMRLVDIRPIRGGEADHYWPGNEGRWQYLVLCEDTKLIKEPFDLKDILGDEHMCYGPAVSFARISQAHEKLIQEYLNEQLM